MPTFQARSFTSSRRFGVELETDKTVSKATIKDIICQRSEHNVSIQSGGWAQSIGNDYWHIKHDSSCGPRGHIEPDYGWEIASYVASGINDIRHIGQIAEVLAQNGVTVNDNCGLHIHAELSDFSPERAGILLAYWIKVEPVVCMLVAPRRLNNKHCKLWAKSDKYDKSSCYDGEQLWNMLRPKNFSPHDNNQKRVALNFVNYAHALSTDSFERKTVELRLPEGTLSQIEVMNWVKLFLHFIENVKGLPMPPNLKSVRNLNDFLSILGLEHPRIFYLLSPELSSLKQWVLAKLEKSQNDTSPLGRKISGEAGRKLALVSVQK